MTGRTWPDFYATWNLSICNSFLYRGLNTFFQREPSAVFLIGWHFIRIEPWEVKSYTSLSSPWWTSQSLTDGSSLPMNSSIALSETCVKCLGWPRGTKLPMPHHQDWQHEQLPEAAGCVCNWGGGVGTTGIDWCIITCFPFSHSKGWAGPIGWPSSTKIKVKGREGEGGAFAVVRGKRRRKRG